MILNVILSIIIIGIWLYIGALSYSYFVSQKVNHYLFKSLFTASFFQCAQGILGIVYIIGITDQYQPIRWIIFSLFEIMTMNMLFRTAKVKRPYELIISVVFMVIVLINMVHINLIFNITIALTLMFIAYHSTEPIVKKYFTISMGLYGMTSIVSAMFSFTGMQSLIMGIIFSISFMIASQKIYDKERIDDKLKQIS